MRPIALDTNAYTAFKRGDAAIVAVLQHAPAIIAQWHGWKNLFRDDRIHRQ